VTCGVRAPLSGLRRADALVAVGALSIQSAGITQLAPEPSERTFMTAVITASPGMHRIEAQDNSAVDVAARSVELIETMHRSAERGGQPLPVYRDPVEAVEP